MISVGRDKTIRFWDIATGEPVRVLRPPIGPGSWGYLFAVAVSPDGRLLAVGGSGAQTPLRDVRIHLIALPEGKIIHSLKGHTGTIYDLAFSPDGKQLASCSHDRTVRTWDAAGGAPAKTFNGHTDIVHGLAWSPDSEKIVSASFDKTARIWSAAAGEEVTVMRESSQQLMAVAWSPDGRVIATGGLDRSIRFYDPTGKLSDTWPNSPSKIYSLAFRPDSAQLVYTFAGEFKEPRGAAILDVQDRRESRKYSGHAVAPLCCAWLRDGGLVATGDFFSKLRVWDPATGDTVHKLDGNGGVMISVGWSPDGQAIAWGHSGVNFTIFWGGPLERTFCLEKLDFGPPPTKEFSRAIRDLGSLRIGQVFKKGGKLQPRMVCISRDKVLKTFFTLPQEFDQVDSFSLISEDRAVVGGNFGGYFFDVKTGRPTHELNDGGAEVFGVAPSPDGRYLLTAGGDQILRVWSAVSGELLLSFFEAGSEWIVWTPNGYYAASFAGENLMGWHLNQGPERMAEFYSAARFHKSLYRPDVIRNVLKVGNVAQSVELANRERATKSQALHVKDVLPPKVTITTPTEWRSEVAAAATIEATAQPVGDDPITALRLIVDGRTWDSPAIADKEPEKYGTKAPDRSPNGGDASARVKKSWTIDLPPGEHSVTVKAETAKSYGLSSPIEIIQRRDSSRSESNTRPVGDLYVLAIGVAPLTAGQTESNDAQSARVVASALESAGSKTFQATHVRTLTDREASASRIEAELDAMQSQMTAADTGVIYYSGLAADDANGELWLTMGENLVSKGHDASGLVAEGGEFSSRRLKESLGRTCGRVVLMLDARRSTREQTEHKTTVSFCSVSEEQSGDRFDAALADLLRDLLTEDNGVVVFSAGRDAAANAADDEEAACVAAAAAAESRPFAQAIVEGLGGKADADRDGVIQSGELGHYVTRRAKELTSGATIPTVERPSGARSFPLGGTTEPPAPAK